MQPSRSSSVRRSWAALLDRLFGWHVRWEGPARDDGRVIHVGILIDDLDDIERYVVEAGIVPFAHADYGPGRRSCFLDYGGTEFEIVSYA